jgi:hypothetical protein
MAPLTNPLRLEVHKRLSAALREITPANGYVSDFSGAEGSTDNKVFRGRAVFGAKDPLPMISILEVPIPIDQRPPPGDSTYSSGGWELMIQGFAVDDRENPTDPAHVMLADVKKRLAKERKKLSWGPAAGPSAGVFGLGRSITNMKLGPGVVRPPDEVSAKAYFWLTIELELVEDLEDPYQAAS